MLPDEVAVCDVITSATWLGAPMSVHPCNMLPQPQHAIIMAATS